MSNQDTLNGITIRHNYQYGDLGIVLSLHGHLYHQEYHFNHKFEAYVAEGLAEFANTYREEKCRLWIAETKGKVIATLAVMERPKKQAQLRWFLVHPDFRMLGLGKLLMRKLLQFCQEAGYQSIFLWTLEHLISARVLYEKFGFHLEKEQESFLWGHNITEQYYLLDLIDLKNKL